MSATTDLVDAMSDDLSPVEEVKEEKELEEVEEVSKDVEESEAIDDSDDDGYIINDEPEKKADEVVDAPKPTQLNTEQQYIYENLPTLSVLGKDGKHYDVKVPNELPQDFEFANARDAANFNAAVASQELKANRLQDQFRGDAAQKSSQEFATREDRAITDDIASLQKSGELGKFKKQPTDADFDTDPTAKQVTEIVDFMQKKNADYLKRQQAGQAYRHIGFEEAFYLYRRENPEKARSVAQKAEDTQRKEVSKNVSSKGTSAKDAKHTPMRSGMQTRDLYAMIDGLE